MKNTKNDDLLPPNAIDVEEAVLGAILLSGNDLYIATEHIRPDSFFKQEHRLIFNAILDVHNRGLVPDIVLVVEQLRKNQTIKLVGGPGYIARLTNKVASSAHLEQHCFILKEKEVKRLYLGLGHKLIDQVFHPSKDMYDLNQFAAGEVTNIMQMTDSKKEISNTELINEITQSMEEAAKQNGITGLRTGFYEHDTITGGYQPGNLIVWGARPGMGKTSLALAVFLNNSIKYNKRMIFFSLEMTASELMHRLICLHMEFDSSKVRRGDFTQEDWTKFHGMTQPLLSDNLIIVDDCYNMPQIQSRIRKEKMKHEIHGAIIDYLQLIEGKGKNRENEVSKISRQCKQTAKVNGIPIIALSQLGRAVDERTDKRPKLTDLRESGAIEQDADVVEFIFRPPYYGDNNFGSNAAFILRAKGRNSGLKDFKLKFIPHLTKFADVDQPEMPF